MHRPTRLVVPAALLLVLTACGGGDDSGETPSASTSTSASPSASPTTSPSPTETATEEQVLDPCAMVPESTWQAVVAEKRRPHLTTERAFVTSTGILISDSRVRYACQVGFDDRPDGYAMVFGYYPGTSTPQDLEELLDSAGGTDVSARTGFPAVTSGDITSSDVYGLVGTTGLFVTVYEKEDSVITGDRAKDESLVQIMKALGSEVDRGTPQPDALLPSYCPATDSPEVTAVAKTVRFARGGDDGAGQWWCLYRDEKAGAELTIKAYHFSDEYFATFYDQTKANPNGVDMFDGPPGVIRMVSLGEDGSSDSILLDPDTKYYVNANLQYAETKRREADRKAIIALVQASYDSIAASAG